MWGQQTWSQQNGWSQQDQWGYPAGDGMLQTAIPDAVAAMIHLETQWDAAKMEKKLKEYFNKAAKNLQMRPGKGIADLIQEYADNAIGSIFAGLGDREWLYTGQADFLLILDAGIKDNFPGHLLHGLSQLEFEQAVLAAYEKAFDEQRFCPILSDCVSATVTGPKIKKKVWNSLDAGRKEAVASEAITVEDFTTTWIGSSVAHLSQSSQGSPESTMPPEQCSQLFVALLEGGALPTSLTAEGAEAPLMLVEDTVKNAYVEHTVAEEGGWQPGGGPAVKRFRGAGGYGSGATGNGAMGAYGGMGGYGGSIGMQAGCSSGGW